MKTLLLTGASGHIGRAVARRAKATGWRVVGLGRRADLEWKLGQPLPPLSHSADALIHLAHDWAEDGRGGDGNAAAFGTLLESARTQAIGRIVLASTVSARADARNRYGRAKFAMESLLDRPGETAARIGMVYGGPPASQWRGLARLAALPLLPMVGTNTRVQPIHVEEVADGLLALAAGQGPTTGVVGLAGTTPITLGAFLRLVARHRHGHPLLLLPLPLGPACRIADLLARLHPAGERLSERLNGMAGLTVLPCGDDLDALSLRLGDPGCRLAEENRRRLTAAEGRALLAMVGGERPGRSVIGRYVRLAEAAGWKPLVLPTHHAVGLRLFDPSGLPGAARHPLAPRLDAATRLLEAPGGPSPLYDYRGRGRAAALLRLALIGAGEALLLPLRLILSRWRP